MVRPGLPLQLNDQAALFYPEVQFSWPRPNVVEISAPWFGTEITFPFEPATTAKKDSLTAALAPRMADQPLIFIVQRANQNKFEASIERDMSGVEAAANPIGKELACSLMARVDLPLRWATTSSILASTQGSVLQAIPAFTVIRWQIFRNLPRHGRTIERRSLAELEYLLQQSYFITSHCEEALSCLPASDSSAFAKGLRAYMREELGHHVFVKRALAAIKAVPKSSSVSGAVEMMMQLLAWCAQNSPFGLANCLGFFEMGGYLRSDPLADALTAAGYNDAARHIKKHFMINKQGEHAVIGLSLSNLLSHISVTDIYIATAVAELQCRFVKDLHNEIS